MISPTGAGGVHQYAWMLSGALEGQGVTVTLAVNGGFEEVPTAGPSNFLTLSRRMGPLAYPENAARVLRASKSSDVVHFQAPLWSPPDSTALLPILSCGDAVLGATLHEVLPYSRHSYHRAVYRRYYTRAKRIAIHSNGHREQLSELGAAPAHVQVVPFGDHGDALGAPDPSLSPRVRLGLRASRLVLFFGLIRPHKGLHDLIEALAGSEETTSLIVAGNPLEPLAPYETHAQRVGVDLVLADEYLGYLSGPQAAACLSDADVLVLPYREGGNSGVLSLAGAFSVPTVVTTAVAPPEYLARVPSRGICPPGDVPALRVAVAHALSGGLAPPERFPSWAEAAKSHLTLWSTQV